MISVSSAFNKLTADFRFLTQKQILKLGSLVAYYDRTVNFNDVISRSRHINFCPHCGRMNAVKYGFDHAGNQRYRCRDCHHTFTITCGTYFYSTKKRPAVWREYLINFFHDNSIRSIADTLKMTTKTAYKWRKKIFYSLSEYQKGIQLQDEIQVDEAFIKDRDRFIEKIQYYKADMAAVAIAVDKRGNLLIKNMGYGMPTTEKLKKVLEGHIKNNPKLIGDAAGIHSLAAKELGIRSRLYSDQKGEAKDHIEKVNLVCSCLRWMLIRHRGYRISNLDKYLDWLSYKWKTNRYKDKEDRLMRKIAEYEPKIRV